MANQYFVEANTGEGWTEVPFTPLYRRYDAQMLAIAIAFTEGVQTRIIGSRTEHTEYYEPSEGQFLRWCADDVGLHRPSFGLLSR